MTPIFNKKILSVIATPKGWLAATSWNGNSCALIKSDGSWEEFSENGNGQKYNTINVGCKSGRIWYGRIERLGNHVVWESESASSDEKNYRIDKDKLWSKSPQFASVNLQFLRNRVGRKPTDFYHAILPYKFIQEVMSGKSCKQSVVVYNLETTQLLIIKTELTKPAVCISHDQTSILAYSHEGYCIFDNPFI